MTKLYEINGIVDINTECLDDRYPKMKCVSQNLFIMKTSGLHHYKEKLPKSFFFLLLPTVVGSVGDAPGGMVNIR